MSQHQKGRSYHKLIPVILLCLCLLLEQAMPVTASSSNKTSKPGKISELSRSSTLAFDSLRTYKLNYNKYKLIKGKSFTLRVHNLPKGYTVTFKSRGSNIATVNSHGKVTGKKNGTVNIVATVKRHNMILRNLTCKVTVGPAAFSVVIPESQITLSVNEKKDLKPIVKPKLSTETPIFISSNTNVVKVSSSGIITGVGTGTATITVSIANKKKDTCKVTVIMAKPKKRKKAK